MFKSITSCRLMLHKCSTTSLKCEQMTLTLVCSIVSSLFHIESINYHLKYPDVRTKSLFKVSFLLASNKDLAMSGCDNLRPPCIYFRPFANSLRHTNHPKWCGKLICDTSLLPYHGTFVWEISAYLH
jgi:hypothetical protein